MPIVLSLNAQELTSSRTIDTLLRVGHTRDSCCDNVDFVFPAQKRGAYCSTAILVLATQFRHRGLDIYVFFLSRSNTLSRCRRHEAKNCRVPSSEFVSVIILPPSALLIKKIRQECSAGQATIC